MRKKIGPLRPKRAFPVSSLFTISFLLLLLLSNLFANAEPIPISGTPKLKSQNYELSKEYVPKKSIYPEFNSMRIFADVINQPQTFWAFNFNYPTDNLNGYYQTPATCKDVYPLPNSRFLYIYVEDGLGISPSTIINIRNEFVANIFPTLSTYFGTPPAKDFTIFILDIKDDYNPAINNTTYVSGYFDFRNEYDYLPYSNKRSMIYLDAHPGQPGSITSLGTLAHEFQHFIHYFHDPSEETWVNEGLSGLARYLCGYGHQAIDSSQRRHIEAFAKYPNTSLTVWNDSLANYGATYLFMLYLYKRYENPENPIIMRYIVANQERGIKGITNALGQVGYAVSFNTLFRNWVIANYLNNFSVYDGIFGYNDDFAGISPAPGNMKIVKTHTSYPANGHGLLNPYAAEYVKFCFLGGIYDIFVLIPHSTAGGSYSYSGYLSSFLLNIDGLNVNMKMSGIQEGTSPISPIVIPELSASNKISPLGGLIWDNAENRCFLAVAFGSVTSREMAILREFRDQILLPSNLGKKIVKFYYNYSPTFSRVISQNEKLKTIARFLIYPIAGLSYALLRYPLSLMISGIIFLVFLIRKFILIKNKNFNPN